MVATTVQPRLDPDLTAVVISNDLVPGLGMPVAAPGLRAFGLAEGLRANGVRTRTVVAKGMLERQWPRFGRSVPAPTAPKTEVMNAGQLPRYLKSNTPAVAIMINSNQIDQLGPIDGVSYVLDFFAPKMLETLYQLGDEYPAEELERLRQRKIEAIKLADAFIVNGRKKLPYFVAWLLQSGRDIRHLPMDVVNMCAPVAPERGVGTREDGVRFAVAGYLQSWSKLGGWPKALERQLDRPGVTLELLTPWHWGNLRRKHESADDLERLVEHPSVTAHGSMNFSDFRRFVAGVDVTVDLFHHNLEREYAMVTRSIISLAAGTPVVHTPFTEVSPMIEAYDAGWLVEEGDGERFEKILEEIITDSDALARKTENARRLADEMLDPKVAVQPLIRIMEGL